MSETAWIVLIGAVCITVILVALKDKVKNFTLKFRNLNTELETHTPPQPAKKQISGNILEGKKHKIISKGQESSEIADNVLKGEGHVIGTDSSNGSIDKT